MLFVEMNPFKAFIGRRFPPGTPPHSVNASHWYDITVLRTKEFTYADAVDPVTGGPGTGAEAIRRRYFDELRTIAAAGETLSPQGAPTLIGECGIPFDLEDGAAYVAWRSGDRSGQPWAKHTVAQSLMYDALDRLLLSSTQWNYTASNCNEAVCGDGWNQEDLSIFSRDQQDNPKNVDSGGRAVQGFSRPYARCIAGEPRAMSFDMTSGEFTLEFEAEPTIDGPTEIFIPAGQYPDGYHIVAPGCDIGQPSPASSHAPSPFQGEGRAEGPPLRAWIFCRERGPHRVTITRRKPQ
jgi:hypothetical protein